MHLWIFYEHNHSPGPPSYLTSGRLQYHVYPEVTVHRLKRDFILIQFFGWNWDTGFDPIFFLLCCFVSKHPFSSGWCLTKQKQRCEHEGNSHYKCTETHHVNTYQLSNMNKSFKKGQLSHYFRASLQFPFYYLFSAIGEGSIANTGNQTPPNHQIHQNFCAKCYQVTIFTMYSNYEKLWDCAIIYFNYTIWLGFLITS